MQNEFPRLATTSVVPEFRCFAYPRLRDDYPFPLGWRPAAADDPIDAIVLTSALPDHALDLILEDLGDPLIPVVSFVPDCRPWVDVAGSEHLAWERAQAIQARLRELAPSVRQSGERADILLARMYSRNRGLDATYSPGDRDFVRYPVAGRLDDVAEIAQGLVRQGLLTRQFFDRVHICPECRSARLSVREECFRCRSPNLHEEMMVHHFRCAHIAPESHFRTGSDFECEKCGRALRHIGLDYDKPGSVAYCDNCGSVNDKPAVGFKCIDCGAKHDSEQVPSRDWYSFRLTPYGAQQLRTGRLAEQQALRAGPDAFHVLLEQANREAREFKIPYEVVRLTFTKADAIKAENVRLWDMTLNLVHDAVHSALREVDIVRQDQDDSFLILMPNTNEESARQAIGFVEQRLETVLKADPGLAFEIADPRQIRRIRNEVA